MTLPELALAGPAARAPTPSVSCRHVRHRPTVIVFVRQPVLGTVKTRLAAGIGRVEALRFYRSTLAQLLRGISPIRSWTTMLAVTPDRAVPTMRRTYGIPAFPQGPGDLGTRMRRAATHRTGPALIIGSDIPDLGPSHLQHAFAALRGYDYVFGPSEDGGYWLAGFANRRPAEGIMRDVRWSTSTALADTLASVDARRRVHVLGMTLADVDEHAGYQSFCETRSGTGNRRWRAEGTPYA